MAFLNRPTAPKPGLCPPIPQANPIRRLAVGRKKSRPNRAATAHPSSKFAWPLARKNSLPATKKRNFSHRRGEIFALLWRILPFPRKIFLNFFLFFLISGLDCFKREALFYGSQKNFNILDGRRLLVRRPIGGAGES